MQDNTNCTEVGVVTADPEKLCLDKSHEDGPLVIENPLLSLLRPLVGSKKSPPHIHLTLAPGPPTQPQPLTKKSRGWTAPSAIQRRGTAVRQVLKRGPILF